MTLTTERTPDATTETAEETADDASHMGKYRLLWQWLQDQGRDEISLTFADVEQVLAMPLPQSARRHPTHWYDYEGTAWAAPSAMPDGAPAKWTSPTRP